MKKAQPPQQAELDPGAITNSTPTTERNFEGTSNPRHVRVLHALLFRPRTRKEVDWIARASNGPQVVAEIRRLGLDLPCTRTPVVGHDGRIVYPGTYSLTKNDRNKVINVLLYKKPGVQA